MNLKEEYNLTMNSDRINQLAPKDFLENNFPYVRHFDGEFQSNQPRPDCYVLHHESGVTALVYHYASKTRTKIKVELVGEKKARTQTKKDISKLLKVKQNNNL